MTNHKPRYFIARARKTKQDNYYWNPPISIRKFGWSQIIFRTGQEFSTKYVAMQQADWINAILDAWRKDDITLAQTILDTWSDGQNYASQQNNGRIKTLHAAPILALKIPSLTLKNDPSKQTVKNLITLYLESSNFDRKKPKTQTDYKNHLKALPSYLLHSKQHNFDILVSDVTKPVGIAYYEKLYKDVSPNAAKARLTVLKLLFFYATDLGWIDKNPFSKLKMAGSKPRVVIWTNAEILQFINQANILNVPSLANAVIIACHTALRQGDILDICEHHFKPKDNQINKPTLKVDTNKTGKLISIPLTDLAEQHINAAITRNKAYKIKYDVIPAEIPLLACERTLGDKNTFHPWKQKNFNTWFNKVKTEVIKTIPEFKTKKFQDLRDTALTLLAKADVNKYGIASVSSHSFESVDKVLKHYIDPNAEMALDAIEKLNNFVGDEIIK